MHTCTHTCMLALQVESMEAEMEELQANVKKKQKPPPRLTELEELVNRHKDHIEKLEKLLRCIDNETITPDEMEDLKTDLDMYLVGTCRGKHMPTCACMQRGVVALGSSTHLSTQETSGCGRAQVPAVCSFRLL